MSLRTKVLRLVELVLRVPPLLIIDEILKIGIVLSDFTEHDLSGFEHSFEENARNASSTLQYEPTFYKLVLTAFIRFMLCMFGKISNQKNLECHHCQSVFFSCSCCDRMCGITMLVCAEYSAPYDSLHVPHVNWSGSCVLLVERWNDKATVGSCSAWR